MILSLDLGTKLGYYVGGRDKAQTHNLGKGDERFAEFYSFLSLQLYTGQEQKDVITNVVYEGAAHQKGFAMPLFHGLVGVLKLFCHENNIELLSVHAMTAKKHFTGKGMWKQPECEKINRDLKLGLPKSKLVKAPMIRKMIELGVGYEDDNSCDAYAVMYTYLKIKSEGGYEED